MSHFDERWKLVRDLIPQIVAKRGETVDTMELGLAVLPIALKTKLLEEATEAMKATPEELEEELADVMEVVLELAEISGISRKRLERTRIKKRKERGGFKKGILLKC